MVRRILALVFALSALAVAQDAKSFLNQGVAAFKNGNLAEAVQSFQKAVDADPAFLPGHLYLATAYMQQYVPGNQTAENRGFADSALREFQSALNLDANNSVATASIASLYLNQKQWDNAQQWYERLTATNPGNADAYYSLGFVAWSRWYPAYSDARKLSGMKPQDPGPLPAGNIKASLKARYTPILEQGMQNLQKALDINPRYDDAMAYMNLLIRERADLMDTPAQYQSEISVANDWVQKALATKKQKAEASQQMPAPPETIQLDEAAQSRRLVTRVSPVVSPDAHVTGTVVLNVLVGKDGHVQQITVKSGTPLLMQASFDAVRQWVYQPTLLNGQPVNVATTVTLTF
ncbi:MAG TPA: energy transducer TonB [Candidatus Sulfopaludibacter sp.]|jgi:tetratricopeptide (TPR) repeat protein|nr:energy transducer TonB [Candidatus Sulfopaludibacter sp.]